MLVTWIINNKSRYFFVIADFSCIPNVSVIHIFRYPRPLSEGGDVSSNLLGCLTPTIRYFCCIGGQYPRTNQFSKTLIGLKLKRKLWRGGLVRTGRCEVEAKETMKRKLYGVENLWSGNYMEWNLYGEETIWSGMPQRFARTN